MSDLPKDLQKRLKKAIARFWVCRGSQAEAQGGEEGDKDRGTRAAVTGGKHLDGFIELIVALLEKAGLQRSHIYWQEKTELPGWFRAEKKWDLLVVADQKLVAAIEFKSQVGSFGNNFNNRAEETIGIATDLWETYENGAFRPSGRPWLGFFMLLEDVTAVKQPVKVREPHFKVLPEFKAASYQERYRQLFIRLVRKRLYDACCLLLSPRAATEATTSNRIPNWDSPLSWRLSLPKQSRWLNCNRPARQPHRRSKPGRPQKFERPDSFCVPPCDGH